MIYSKIYFSISNHKTDLKSFYKLAIPVLALLMGFSVFFTGALDINNRKIIDGREKTHQLNLAVL